MDGKARQRMAMHGRSRKVLQGMARQKKARPRMRRPGPAWQGNVTQNRASLGKEGNASKARNGMAR